MALVLVVIYKSTQRRVKIKDDGLIVGRSSKCNLKIIDPKVSGKHLQVHMKSAQVWIEDLSSSNGTNIDDNKITKQRLYLGEEVKIGDTILILDPAQMTEEEIKRHSHDERDRLFFIEEKKATKESITCTGVTAPTSPSLKIIVPKLDAPSQDTPAKEDLKEKTSKSIGESTNMAILKAEIIPVEMESENVLELEDMTNILQVDKKDSSITKKKTKKNINKKD